MLEIYNEVCRDLLTTKQAKEGLKIKMNARKGFYGMVCIIVNKIPPTPNINTIWILILVDSDISLKSETFVEDKNYSPDADAHSPCSRVQPVLPSVVKLGQHECRYEVI